MNTVLVAENHKNLGILYQQELKLEGYNVLLARNGREAIAKIEEQIPDIMVMEITMPIMDGIEAIRKKINKHYRMPIIINTAFSRYKENFMTRIADAYIVKSSNLSKLKNKIKELLGKKICWEQNMKSELFILQ